MALGRKHLLGNRDLEDEEYTHLLVTSVNIRVIS